MSATPAIPSGSPTVDAQHPWPGLESFTERDFEYFNGRDVEIDDLLRLVRRDTLTVLFGKSGLGKTSLLKAGLFPKLLNTDFLPVYIHLTHSDTAPPLAAQVYETIGAIATAQSIEAPKAQEQENLWTYFHRDDADFWDSKNRLLLPVLVFDQFEEIFTLGRENNLRRERAQAFLEELADLVERRPPAAVKQRWEDNEGEVTKFSFDRERCKILLSLREDYLSDLEGLRSSMRSVMRNRFRIRRMNGENALKVVTQPVPGLVPDEVAIRLVQLVAKAGQTTQDPLLDKEQLKELELEPALLSLVCRELNANRLRNGQRTITDDLLRESYHDILQRFYDESVANVPPEVRYFIEDQLLTPSGFRTSVALESALAQKGITKEVINQLVKRRLLRIEDRLNVPSVELTHDILTTEIRVSRDARQKQAAEAALAAERERAEREKQKAAADLAEARLRAQRERKKTMIAGVAFLAAAILGLFALRWSYVAHKALQETKKTKDDTVQRIGRMLFGLRDKLMTIDRRDMLQDATDETLKYMESLKHSEVTDAMLYTQAATFEIRADILLYNKGEVSQALSDYERALGIFESLGQGEPDNSDYKFARAVENSRVGDVTARQGDLNGAIESYRKSLALIQTALAQEKDPEASDLALLSSYRDTVAEGLMEQGKLEEARKLYQQSLDERTRRAHDAAVATPVPDNDAATAEPIPDESTSDLPASYLALGVAIRESGDVSAALKMQQDGLALRKQLAEADTSDLTRQHDLSQSYDRVGEALQDLGKLDDAIDAFSASESIFERLNELDPSNVGWMRNLSVTLVRLANLTSIFGDLSRVDDTNAWVLKTRESLADIDETDADAKDDLSEACVNLGDSLLLCGDLNASAQNYERAFSLRSETANKDVTNFDRQELLAESLEKLGDISLARGKFDRALQRYENSQEIRERLAGGDPSNALRQASLAKSKEKIGDASRELGNNQGALEAFQANAAILETLGKKDPSNTEWQGELAVAYRKVAEMNLVHGNADAASTYFQKSIDLLTNLTQLAQKNSEWKASLCDSITAFAETLSPNEKQANLDLMVKQREELADLDQNNVKRQAEFAHALYLASLSPTPSGQTNNTAHERLTKSKQIMHMIKDEAQLTAEEQKWATKIDQAR